MKTFYIQYNIGRVKYLVNHRDGTKFYPDGSPFHDIATFRNKEKMKNFVHNLGMNGYKYEIGKP